MEIRRKITSGATFTTPKIGVIYPTGHFRVYKKTINLLGIDMVKQALMFDIKKDHIIMKVEAKVEDNYYLTGGSSSNGFACKHLANEIANAFELPKHGKHTFEVEKFGKDYKLTLNNRIV